MSDNQNNGINGKPLKITVVTLLVIATIIYVTIGNFSFESIFYGSAPGEFVFSETGYELEYNSYSEPSFYTYFNANGYFYATKDGMKFIDTNGNTKMSHMYNMTAPLLIGENDIVAISEQSGNKIYVFNSSGLLYEQQMKNPILNFSINQLGQCSVITQSGDEYLISVFTQNGGLIHENLFPAKNTFPVTTAISNDGRMLAVLYYDISGVNINSQITFFLLNKSEALDYEDSIFGANNDFSDEVIYSMKFMDGNMLVTFSNKAIACIDTQSGCRKIWNMPLNNKLDAICFNGSDTFVVAYGDGFINTESEPAGLVKMFKTDMSEISSYMSKGRVTYLYGGNSAIIVGNKRHFTAINNRGEVIWDFNAAQDVRQMFFIEGTSKILIAGDTKASIIRGAVVPKEPEPEFEPGAEI